MAERPLLIFPNPVAVGRHKKHGGPSDIHFPPPTRQRDRLAPKFDELERALRNQALDLRDNPTGIEPERVLVLETVGGIDEFFKALAGIEGLEWLGDADTDGISQDEDFYEGDVPGVGDSLRGRLYLVMSNQRGLHELLALWRIFQGDPENVQFRRGRAKWKHMFRQLRDIRPWGPNDRIVETGLLEVWQERVQDGQETVRVEVELWFRNSEAQRTMAQTTVHRLILASNGIILSQASIPEIAYHAVLAQLPIGTVEEIVHLRDTNLVQCDQVMFFRPVGQATMRTPEDDNYDPVQCEGQVGMPEGAPIVAILDGLPLENHRLLAQRLIVDDPDGWAGDYPPEERVHGTAMASLVVHGELDAGEHPLRRPVYIRPLMKPNPFDFNRPRHECIPEEALPIDLVHRSVRRIVEGEGGQAPAAPTVRVVNLSICDSYRPFDSMLSAWARLMDFLSWRYKILIVVSAGNHYDLELDVRRTDFDKVKAVPARLEQETIRAMLGNTRHRRLYSPAEGMNVLTVGSTHSDFSTGEPRGHLFLPLASASLPSPYSAHGLGFRRSVKPDVLFKGGRQPYREKLVNPDERSILQVSPVKSPPGQRVATPGAQAGDLNSTCYMRGTSNSAALVTRSAAKAYEVLEELRADNGGERLTDEYVAVLLKALMIHGASWGEAAELIRRHAGDVPRDTISRLLGYGELDSTRVMDCTESRATLLGCGHLGDGNAHLYRLPLPTGLSGSVEWRKLTVTVAWLSPMNPYHRNYRLADVWFEPHGVETNDGSAKDLLRVKRRNADWQTVRRGTVQHEVFEGVEASVFGEEDFLQIQVNCRSDAGSLYDQVPYGLAVSLEVRQGIDIPVYATIRERIRNVVPVQVTNPVRP